MAMSTSLLATELKPEIKAKIEEFFSIEAIGAEMFDKFCQALAEAIANKVVPHIQDNAVVTVVVTSVSGVTAGGGVSGPGTGTGTIQ